MQFILGEVSQVLTQNILRLKVSVHYVTLMHVVQRQQKLVYHGSCFMLVKAELAICDLAHEISPLHEFHDHVEIIFVLHELIGSHNLRVVNLL